MGVSLACSSFIYTENLELKKQSGDKEIIITPNKKTKKELRGDTWLVNLLRNATEQTAGEDGWSHLGKVGLYISNNSSFSPLNYGYKKLGDLITVSELFDIDRRKNNELYIKDNRNL